MKYGFLFVEVEDDQVRAIEAGGGKKIAAVGGEGGAFDDGIVLDACEGRVIVALPEFKEVNVGKRSGDGDIPAIG